MHRNAREEPGPLECGKLWTTGGRKKKKRKKQTTKEKKPSTLPNRHCQMQLFSMLRGEKQKTLHRTKGKRTVRKRGTFYVSQTHPYKEWERIQKRRDRETFEEKKETVHKEGETGADKKSVTVGESCIADKCTRLTAH